MKLVSVPNLRVEDFSSDQSWIGDLFVQLNPFIQGVSQVVNGGVDYVDNINSVTRSYDQTGFRVFSFQWSFLERNPSELRVIKASKGNAQTPTILQASWSFDATSRSITVSSMIELSTSGVSALSGRYQFTLRATV